MVASLGGVLVTVVSIWISQHAKDLPHLGLPFGLGTDAPATWRYLLMTGLLPAIPIALLLPFLLFFTIGRPIAGIICLILQITLIGWIPAAIWAVYALSPYNTDRKITAATGGRV